MKDEIKLHKLKLEKFTTELKSHLYLDSFFVDPDKKFIELLKNLIVF